MSAAEGGLDRQYQLVSFINDEEIISESSVANSRGYLSDIALIERIDYSPEISSEPDTNITYLSFNLSHWIGQLNSETTLLTRLFITSPQWLFLPTYEQENLAERAVASAEFQEAVQLHARELIGDDLAVEEIAALLTSVADDINAGIGESQRLALSKRLGWNLQLAQQKLSSGPVARSASVLPAANKTTSEFNLLAGATSRTITIQQTVSPDGNSYLPHVDLRNHTSLYYVIQEKSDMASGYLNNLLVPTALNPQRAGFEPDMNLASDQVQDVAINEPLVIYRNNPNYLIDKPSLMNSLALIEVVAKAGMPILAKPLKALRQKSGMWGTAFVELGELAGNAGEVLAGTKAVLVNIELAGTVVCDLVKALGDEGSNHEYYATQCVDGLKGVRELLTAIGGVTDELTDLGDDSANPTMFFQQFRTAKGNYLKQLRVLRSAQTNSIAVPMVTQFLNRLLGADFVVTSGGVTRNNKDYAAYWVGSAMAQRNTAFRKSKRWADLKKMWDGNSAANLYRTALRSVITGGGNSVLNLTMSDWMLTAQRLSQVHKAWTVLADAMRNSVTADGVWELSKNVVLFLGKKLLESGAAFSTDVLADFLISMTPAKIVQVGQAANVGGAMAWDLVTKPAMVEFSISKDSSGKMSFAASAPPLEHLRYLNVPAAGRPFVLHITHAPSRGIQPWQDEQGQYAATSLSVDAAVNNLLVMPGIELAVENKAGFVDSDKEKVRDYFALTDEFSTVVSTDWHSYRHPAMDGHTLFSGYSRSRDTAYNLSYFVDKIAREELDCPKGISDCRDEDEDDVLYQVVRSSKEADAVTRAFMNQSAIDKMQFIAFSTIYNARGRKGNLIHSEPGIYTNSTTMAIGTTTYSNAFNLFVAVDYDYATSQARSHRDSIAAASSKLVRDGAITGIVLKAEQLSPGFNYWGNPAEGKDGIGAYPFYVVMAYADGSFSAPGKLRALNGEARFVPVAAGRELSRIYVYDSLFAAYLNHSGASYKSLLKRHDNRYEGANISRPFAVISPDELPIYSSPDVDGDTVPDIFDTWPTDARFAIDLDGNGMADEWERHWGLDTASSDISDASADPDGDGYSNLEEFLASLTLAWQEGDWGYNPLVDDMGMGKLQISAGDGQLQLRWRALADATGYTLYWLEASSDATAADAPQDLSLWQQQAVEPQTEPEALLQPLTNGQRYWLQVVADHPHGPITSAVALATPGKPLATGKLNDTGITSCSNNSQNGLSCPVAGFAGQDAEHGRDVTHNDDSDGHAGFSFTKLDGSGNPLPASASNWSCVKDNVTGLIWEIKTTDGGLRDMNHTYTWYNSNPATNGGAAGTESGGTCYNAGRCDTEKFVADVNAAGLCGANDWRMPSIEELQSIVDYSRVGPAIDTAWFPNTSTGWMWSSSPSAYYTHGAWYLDVYNGGVNGYGSRSSGSQVRLVRGGQ